MQNLIPNPSFEIPELNSTPAEYATWAPWDAIAPTFAVDAAIARTGQRSLRIDGAGRTGCYGYWATQIDGLRPGKHYRIRVYAKAEQVQNLDRNVAVKLSWFGSGNDHVSRSHGVELLPL